MDDANSDFLIVSEMQWDRNIDICAVSTFVVSSDTRYLHQSTPVGWEVDLRLRYTMNEFHVLSLRNERGKPENVGNSTPKRRLKVIDLANHDIIRTSISVEGRNASENRLLTSAFGPNHWDKLESLDDRNRNLHCRNANEKINASLSRAKPQALDIEFYLEIESHSPLKITVGLEDRFGGRAFPHLRGAGYQKLMGLMLLLLDIDLEVENVLLLYDEPENSLHADAQHAFRKILEDFAEHQNIQVVYATHSPAMINPARPKSLRLLYRDTTIAGYATTRINNKPYVESSYQSVRAQLGILPADSLMFSAVTIIVEGPTERLALNRLIDRLIDERTEICPDLKLHWRLCFVLSAGGTGEIPKWIKFAASQNVRPIVLVDGDTDADTIKSKGGFENVRVVSHAYGKDFEGIVTEELYFKALAEVLANLGKSVEKTTKEEFDKWWASAGLTNKMMFSSRVAKWLESEFQTCLNKPIVMDKAIEIADLDSIKMCKIDELIEEIKKAVDSL